MIQKKDWFWLIGFPIYLTISTFRHESAHALMAQAQGAEILSFVFWPSLWEGSFYFGYVRWHGETNWLVMAAPYFMDVLTSFAAFWPVMFGQFKRHWVWLNLMIIGLISPLVNSVWNYWRGSDVRRMLEILPAPLVHGAFLMWLGLCLGMLVLAFTQSEHAKRQTGQETAVR